MEKERFDPLAPKPLDKVPVSLWAEVWNSLNRYEWHEALGKSPDGWDDAGKTLKEAAMFRGSIVRPIMDWIELELGNKGCLRYSHKKDGKTDQQFDDWWDSLHFELLKEMIEEKSQNSPASIILCGMGGAAFAMLVKFLIGLAIG